MKRIFPADFWSMCGHVSSHGSSIALKDEENTVEKEYFAEGTCHAQTFDNVPEHDYLDVQPQTLVPLNN